jgi:hypothetical protein
LIGVLNKEASFAFRIGYGEYVCDAETGFLLCLHVLDGVLARFVYLFRIVLDLDA